jgi:putative transposase
MAHTYANLMYHIVFSTKNRLPLIGDGLRERLYEYMGGIVRGVGGSLMEVGGVTDHVHLLVRSKTDIAVATLVKKIKGQSSKWANGLPDRPKRFQWQEGYGAFSVSASVVPKVQRYIRSQEEHHRRISFKDELITLLKRHHIPYDERYLLD